MKWEDFTEDIRVSYTKLRTSLDFTDVTLACEDGVPVEAHKTILAACSSVFANILQSNTHPKPLIFFRRISHDAMSSILDFIYYGEVKIEFEQLNQFLEVAEDLKLKGISNQNELEEKVVFTDQIKMSETNYDKNLENGDFRVLSMNKNGQNEGQTQNDIQTIPFNEFNEPSNPKDNYTYFVIKDIETNIHQPTDHDLHTTDVEKNKDELFSSDNKLEDMCYECTVCGKVLKSKYVLSNHAKKHLSGLPTNSDEICPTCEKVFESKSSLYKHFSMDHKSIKVETKKDFEDLDLEIKPLVSKINGFWTCQVCGKQINHRAHIINHVESRHMDLSIPCSKCGHTSKSRDSLRAHTVRDCKFKTM